MNPMHFTTRRLPVHIAPATASVVAPALAPLAFAAIAAAANVDLPRHPALSPNGATVVFAWRGDLWSAPAAGGNATRLTSNPATEMRSGFTPDGTRIVFESERDGLKNLWSMATDGSDLRQITDLDAMFSLSSVGMLNGKIVVGAPRLHRSRQPQRLGLRHSGQDLRAAHQVGGQRRTAALHRRRRVRLHLRPRHRRDERAPCEARRGRRFGQAPD